MTNRCRSKALTVARSPHLIIAILMLLLVAQIVQNQLLVHRSQAAATLPASPIIGKHITAPALSSIDGQDLDLSQMSGTYHVLIFFHTKCEYCSLDLPLWKAIGQGAASRDIDVVGVTPETDTEAVAQFVRQNDIRFPVLLDPEGQLQRQLGVDGTPTKALLSSDMRVLQVWHGWTTQESNPGDLGGMLAFLGIEPEVLPHSAASAARP